MKQFPEIFKVFGHQNMETRSVSVAYTLQPDPPPWTLPEQGISRGWEPIHKGQALLGTVSQKALQGLTYSAGAPEGATDMATDCRPVSVGGTGTRDGYDNGQIVCGAGGGRGVRPRQRRHTFAARHKNKGLP